MKIADNSLGMTFPMIVIYNKFAGTGQSVGAIPVGSGQRCGTTRGGGLVLISHGSGGLPFVYRSIARHLARSGFIVGLPEHPHNNRNDNCLEWKVRSKISCIAPDTFPCGRLVLIR